MPEITQHHNRPDLELLARQLERDPESHATIEQLTRCYGGELIQFFRNRGFHNGSQDLAQETLIRVYLNIDTFRQEASVRTWLLKIAVNVWKNALRDQGAMKRTAKIVPLEEAFPGEEDRPTELREVASAEGSPFEHTLDKENTRLLCDALRELPPKMRSAFEMQFFQDLTIRQIAALLRVSETTVKSNLRDARARLRPLLREHFGVQPESYHHE